MAQVDRLFTERIAGAERKGDSTASLVEWWVNFIRCYEQMQERGLQRIWSAVLAGTLPVEKIELGLALALHDQLAREVIQAHPELMRISGTQRNALQASFKEYDKKLITLQRQRIAAQIARRHVPEGNAGGKKSEYTELALIKNELGKKQDIFQFGSWSTEPVVLWLL